ncbi:SusE domain-containing protein [Flavobacterium sp. 3HN19-14]|uniref:SusE domain-containing protein n=1 Tax=Flavobacterium sp. 3HN19-14 TaxID=3448133 RepID=UPI003EE3D32A
MKNSIKLLIAFIGLLSVSCTEDVQDTPAATPDTSLKLLSPNSSFNLVLDGAKLDNLATTFVWQDPKNPNDESVAYTVEAAVGGTNFAAPITLGTTTGHFLDLTVGQLDTAAKTLGLEPLVEGQMDVRITNASESSNFFTLKVTPYQPHWGIIGSATPHGWESSTDMAFNPMTGKYSISLGLLDGAYKFRLDNSWTTNYGDDGNNLTLEQNGADIPATAGNYTIVLDIENHSYTITPITNAWVSSDLQLRWVGITIRLWILTL